MFSSKTVNDLTESIIHSHRRFIHVRRFTSHKRIEAIHKRIEAIHKRVSIQKRGGRGEGMWREGMRAHLYLINLPFS